MQQQIQLDILLKFGAGEAGLQQFAQVLLKGARFGRFERFPLGAIKRRQVGGLPRGVGSDHDSFLSRGVPGFFWRQSGRANYTHTHHTQHDTFDAAIPEYQKHSSKVIALGALGVANLDEKLSRQELAASQQGFAPGRRRLGIQLGSDDDLTIESVVDGSRAEKAGLKTGDRIVKIDDVAVKDRGQMSDALNQGGLKKTITFVRQVTVEFPAPDSRPQ